MLFLDVKIYHYDILLLWTRQFPGWQTRSTTTSIFLRLKSKEIAPTAHENMLEEIRELYRKVDRMRARRRVRRMCASEGGRHCWRQVVR